jgi:CarD family transcriptional regulator
MLRNVAVTEQMARDAFAATAAQARPSDAAPFRLGDTVVYAAHGVGRVDRVGVETIAGHAIEIIRVAFLANRMTLRVPAAKARVAGLRRLSSPEVVRNAMKILEGRSRTSKAVWVRRAEGLQQKLNSGDLLNIARVLRDLRRNAGSLDGSHAERQIFETALDRFATEVSSVGETDKDAAVAEVMGLLQQPRAPEAGEEDQAAQQDGAEPGP